MPSIPTIDLSEVNIGITDKDQLKETAVQNIGNKLVEALFDVGFLYVINHGIANEDIEQCSASSKTFFSLPHKTKMKYARDWTSRSCGYLPQKDDEIQVERFDLTKPLDCKEVIDVCHKCDSSVWPNSELPEFQAQSRKIIDASQRLVRRLMLLLGYGMKLDNPKTFWNGFHGFNSQENGSQLRYLYYPPVEKVDEGQMRCGEHTDYGCMTFVYMDSTPGLQVFTRQGQYLDIDSVPGAVLVNIGDLMQRWSGDKLLSAKHRVVFRSDSLHKSRYSIVYFSHTDDEVVISPVIGAMEKYPPVRTLDHMHRRFADTFSRGKGLDEELTGLTASA